MRDESERHIYVLPLRPSDQEQLSTGRYRAPYKLKVLANTPLSNVARYLQCLLREDARDLAVRILVAYRTDHLQVPESLTVDEIGYITHQWRRLELKYAFVPPPGKEAAPPPLPAPKKAMKIRHAVLLDSVKTNRRELPEPYEFAPAGPQSCQSPLQFFSQSWDLAPGESGGATLSIV
jgi:hypothetical protein